MRYLFSRNKAEKGGVDTRNLMPRVDTQKKRVSNPRSRYHTRRLHGKEERRVEPVNPSSFTSFIDVLIYYIFHIL